MTNPDKASPLVHQVSPFENHVKETEKRLEHWGAELDKLAQTALSIQAAQKEAFDIRVIEIRAKLDFAQNELERLRCAGEHKWEAFKEDLELSVRNLEKAFKS